MRSTALAAGALFAATAQAVDGVVQMDIARRQLKPKLAKRAGDTFEEVITNEQANGGYFTSCSVGSPGQALTLQLDTGSSDVWVPSSSADVCKGRGSSSSNNKGCSFGSFDSSASTSFTVVGEDEFNIAYVDGSKSQGDYFTDSFEIGGANLKNLTMGLGRETDIPYGLVGVGYASNEAVVSSTRTFASAYPNLPVAMVDAGLIKTTAYSLWLNDLDASTGNILFGGIDTDKYVGDLTRIQIYKDQQSDNFTSFMVALTSVQAFSSSGSDVLSSRELPVPVVLDSGTTLSYLPTDMATQIWNEVGAVYSDDIGMAVIPCNMENSQGFFSFGFAGPNGPKINVTMDELVLELTSGSRPTFTSGKYKGQEACEFGIQNFSSDPFLLGDTFLRSAYVVYDLVNNEIGIAPTDFNATTSNIVAFASQGAPIPSATVAPNQDQVGSSNPSATSPSFTASQGFIGSAGKNAASIPVALDASKVMVMGLALGFTLLGSVAFL